jgi:hypothetical protein
MPEAGHDLDADAFRFKVAISDQGFSERHRIVNRPPTIGPYERARQLAQPGRADVVEAEPASVAEVAPRIERARWAREPDQLASDEPGRAGGRQSFRRMKHLR